MLRLYRPADAAAVRADPDLALRIRDSPLLIDEWQLVPEVLGAVKRAVDDDPRPARFVITGSAQRFAARLRTKWLPRIAGVVFAGFAVAAGWTAVLG
jgi:predicted AAA+ superfamily ATPase